MPVRNAEVAEMLEKLADLLAIKGENQFRIRAYRNAARTITGMQAGVAALVERGEDLSAYPGIGKAIAEKITEIVETGSLSKLEEATGELPEGLLDLLRIPELGPRRVKELYDELGITSIDELASALEEGRVRELEGFGEKLEQSLLSQVKSMRNRAQERRLLLPAAEEIAEDMVAYLKRHGDVKRIAVAGSYRRRKETVGDLDILVVAGDGSAAGGAAGGGMMDVFTGHEDVRRVSMKGETRSSVVLRSGVQVDLRLLDAGSYGSALQYFTGSREHNIAVRRVAQEQGLKVSEYGIFRGDERVAGAEEDEMYTTLGLAWIPPELRENRGEVEAAREGKLPELVTLDDIRGDLHSHTNASDGGCTLEEMAEAARARGYEYLAVSDHSKSLTVAHGLDEDRLARQMDDIAELNERFDGFRLLRSIEVDILDDGRLDLSDEILARLDFVICSIHSGLNKTEEKQTERIIRAMDNPHCSIIGHPTGRLLGSRDAYPVNMRRLLEAAAERGVSLEINAQPERLDLRDEDAHAARELGIKLSIATDAHAPANLAFMRYGVDQARRGGLGAADVLNTRPWPELGPLLKRG
ncbi:MAG: DNA polymerase/3'-5' exonuclease PolX [Spirochaetaceae bacterium]